MSSAPHDQEAPPLSGEAPSTDAPGGDEPAGDALDAGRTNAAGSDADGSDAGASESEPAETASTAARLEREGDIAADYLEGLLDIADLDGDIDLDVENDRAMVSIVGDGLDDLVGADGRGLDALQELVRLAVLRETGERSRLMLDIAGTRARRRVELTTLGTDTAERARSANAPVRLATMNPFERKVIHDAVAAAGLRSESEGVEPDRHVVVYPV